MLTLKSLTKKELYALDPGISVGKPIDILVDPEKHEVALLVLSYGYLSETSVVCDAEAVGEFGNDTLTISDLHKLHLAINDEASLDDLADGISLRKRTVMSPDGVTIGTITATEIDAKGKVLQYRLRKPRFGLLRPGFVLKPDEIDRLSGTSVVASDGKKKPATRRRTTATKK